MKVIDHIEQGVFYYENKGAYRFIKIYGIKLKIFLTTSEIHLS